MRPDARRGTRYIQFGVRGQSDILAVLPPSGRLLAIETKAARGRLTKDQNAFIAMVRKAGGVALVIRDVAELAAALDREQERHR